jgi:UDP-glucose:(heptosyl)LPS alpha-1,3-glucosyltransferase
VRITICCKRFGPSGGAEAFLGNFARCLAADGHRVRVLAADFTGSVEGVEARKLALPPLPKSLQDLALARASRRALAAEDADLTFSDQRCWGAEVVRPGGGVEREYFAEWLKSYRSPARAALARLQHALSLRDRLRVHIDDVLYAPPGRLGPPGPRCVIANSRMVRDQLLRHYPHLADRIRVVHNAVDTERFRPELKAEHRERVRSELGLPQEALVGVFVGTGWQRKGLYTFIAALGAALGAERAAFGIVVGKGPRRAAQAFARRCGAGERVRFVGEARPDPYYGAADFVALPSYFDTFGLVILEGLACGLPVLTTAHAGGHEVITPGRDGFVIEEASNSEALAGQIAQLEERRFLAAASQAARATALEHTLERQYREIMEAIGPLARGR